MKYEQFVELVQNRALLKSRGAAVAAIRATMETLASRLTIECADHLASQLPNELAYYIMNASRADYQHGERFDLEQFYDRVAESERVNLPDAIFHARVVMEVLFESVSWGEMDKLLAHLPDEYERLFDAGSMGLMRRRRRVYGYYSG